MVRPPKGNHFREQLNSIVRALLIAEAKLYKEQKTMLQKLAEQDQVISHQRSALRSLKRKYGEDSATVDGQQEMAEEADVPQFCPRCRRDYFLLTQRNEATQTSSTEESVETDQPERRDDSTTATVAYHYQTHDQSDKIAEYTEEGVAVNPLETSNDWYVSDTEEAEETRQEDTYRNRSDNPVLECVSQILLQEHEEVRDEDDDVTPITPPQPSPSLRSKRVHFALQSTPNKPAYGSSNGGGGGDYELVGSSNVYVEMESKADNETDEPLLTTRRKPPALPPKPTHLIKPNAILRQRVLMRNKTSPFSELNASSSEPDYCSIHDVRDVYTVAEIHKPAEATEDDEDPDESFEDIPKLPMVAEIVPPPRKDTGRFINYDNYVTKSPAKLNGNTRNRSREQIAKILADITKLSPAGGGGQQRVDDAHSDTDWYSVDFENAPPASDTTSTSDHTTPERNTRQSTTIRTLDPLPETPGLPVAGQQGDAHFQCFLEDSGLSSKPILPRKKRIYYSGPYV